MSQNIPNPQKIYLAVLLYRTNPEDWAYDAAQTALNSYSTPGQDHNFFLLAYPNNDVPLKNIPTCRKVGSS